MSIRVTQIRRPPRELLMTERRLSPFQRAMLRWCQPGSWVVGHGSWGTRRTNPRPKTQDLRPTTLAEALLETCAWLEAHGWAGTDRGWLQAYSLWLIAQREDYARTAGA